MTSHDEFAPFSSPSADSVYLRDPQRQMQLIRERLGVIRERIARAAEAAGRPVASVELVAVSKMHPAGAVLAALGAGQTLFGESRLQEALPKAEAVAAAGPAIAPQWHLIGHLQRNKAAQAAGAFALIHSVDSVRLIEELERQAVKKGVMQQILLQINVSGEASKSGAAPQELPALLDALDASAHLTGEGLMTIPPADADPRAARPHFARLRELLGQTGGHERFTPRHLSMGMSDDFEVAIAEGATLVRVGSAIFGARAYP